MSPNLDWRTCCKTVLDASAHKPEDKRLRHAATYAAVGLRTYDVRGRATIADMILRDTPYWRGDDAKEVRDSLKAYRMTT